MRLDVANPDARLAGDDQQVAHLFFQRCAELASTDIRASSSEAFAVRIRRMCAHRDPVGLSGSNRGGHGGGVARVTAAGDIAGTYDGEQLRVSRSALAEIRIQIDAVDCACHDFCWRWRAWITL